ncbi:MAG: sulfur carrier protein ThiS [Hyphomicrobiaceae bacterium]|nr:sulfur carrier protein ThiS [Hyphomicrobiaceae bacterium]
MRVYVNGEARTTTAATLAALVADLELGPALVATALNGDFVPASRRGEIVLRSGDAIEVVSARQGG